MIIYENLEGNRWWWKKKIRLLIFALILAQQNKQYTEFRKQMRFIDFFKTSGSCMIWYGKVGPRTAECNKIS